MSAEKNKNKINSTQPIMLYNKRKLRIWWNRRKPYYQKAGWILLFDTFLWMNVGIEAHLMARDFQNLMQPPPAIMVTRAQAKTVEQKPAPAEDSQLKKPVEKPMVKAAAIDIEPANIIKLDMTNDDGRIFLQTYGTEKGMTQAQITQLARIIQAESGWEHTCKQVRTGCKKVGAVKQGPTQDYGYAQIHLPTHKARLAKLGLDIMDPEDNLKFAVLLYQEQGAGPWNASKHRANKTGWAD